MTNLEWYYREMVRMEREDRYDELNAIYDHEDRVVYGFAFIPPKHLIDANDDEFEDWLLSEHKDPIKLTQFEYDLLDSYVSDDNGRYCFCDVKTFSFLKEKGYFEGVTDANMTLEEILDNCEVIDE